MRSIDTDTAVAGEGERWWAGGDMETSSTGSIRWLPDGEEMVGSSKFTVVLCMKTSCKPGKKSCYCCRTLPDNASCFWTQQQCWDSCPAAPLAATPAAAVASSILEELCRSITWEQFRTGCILETICDDLVSCICLENKPHKSMCETFCRVCVFIWTFGSRWFFFFWLSEDLEKISEIVWTGISYNSRTVNSNLQN
jgi:hypothetical protein